MSIKKVSVVTPNGEHTIITSRPKAVQAVITYYGQATSYEARDYRSPRRYSEQK